MHEYDFTVDDIPAPDVGVRLLEDWYRDVCRSDPDEAGVDVELQYLANDVWFENNDIFCGPLPIVPAGGGGYELPECGLWDVFYVPPDAITKIVGKMLDSLDDDDGPHGLAIIRRAYRRHC